LDANGHVICAALDSAPVDPSPLAVNAAGDALRVGTGYPNGALSFTLTSMPH
jgi:hypothetical protein